MQTFVSITDFTLVIEKIARIQVLHNAITVHVVDLPKHQLVGQDMQAILEAARAAGFIENRDNLINPAHISMIKHGKTFSMIYLQGTDEGAYVSSDILNFLAQESKPLDAPVPPEIQAPKKKKGAA
jgi:hypothetical protein